MGISLALQRRKQVLDQMDGPPNPAAPVTPAPTAPAERGPQVTPAPVAAVQTAAQQAQTPYTPPASNFNYEAARDDWMGNNAYNISTPDAARQSAAQWAAAHGIQYDGGDTIQLPNGGGAIDILGNFSSGQNMARNWTPAGGNGPGANGGNPAYGGVPGGGGAGSGGNWWGGGGSGSSSESWGGTGGADIQAAFREQMLRLLKGNQGAIDPTTDPNLKGQAQAYKTARDRAAQQERATMAERAAASGLNSGGAGSGAFDSGIQGIQEQSGQDISGYNAGLVGQEVQARRAELENALQLANAFGARQEANSIQMALAQLDNQYRYAALGQNQGQYEDSQAFNWAQLQAQLNRQALLAGMGGGNLG